MSDIEKAKSILQNGDFTCVLCKDGTVYSSTMSGISPMIEFMSSGKDLKGFSAADKIVGKAAAMLFVLTGIKEVYAPVMSETAVSTLSHHGVLSFCDILTKVIVNRDGNGICPMENAVKDIDDPLAAFDTIKRTLTVLKNRSKEKIQ